MARPSTSEAGRVAQIWRYPIKSMMGEELDVTDVADRGVTGDRMFALVDIETGNVASAKNPRRWPNLFEFKAALVEPSGGGHPPSTARITFPDGDILTTDKTEVECRLSAAVGRTVRLARSPFAGASSEGYWPDQEWLSHRDQVFEFSLPAGTFFDGALVHLVTTATLERLTTIAPESQFQPRRFRPNFLIRSPEGTAGFVENDWIGRTLELGEAALRIDGPCPRCVMTTLSQGHLPKDAIVLRTAVQANEGNVGVYASVVRAGKVHRGDAASLS